jgi:anti-sigma B factor antagonist
MRTYSQGDVLLVTGFKNLSADNAGLMKEFVNTALKPEHRFVEVDLATADFVDSTGLGVLIAFHKRVCPLGGRVRLVNPKPMVEQFFQLIKLDHLFEMIRRGAHE